MGKRRQRAVLGMLAAAAACWIVVLGAGIAQAEDWTPPPGAPPGCQPPPGECFPPPEGSPTGPPTPPTPTPAPTSASSSSATPKQPTESKQPQSSDSPRGQDTPSTANSDGQQSSGAAADGQTTDSAEAGDAPTLQVAPATLRVGEPVRVPISVLGLNRNENPQIEAIVTVSGGIGQVGETTGSTLTFVTLASDLVPLLQDLSVTAESPQVTVSVRAYPVGKPGEAVFATRTLTAVGATAPTTATPTQSQQPTNEATSLPAASSSSGPTLSARTISLPAYNPLDEPQATVDTTVAAVALIGAVGLAAGSVATGLTGAAGGSAPTPAGSSETRGPGSAERSKEQATSMLAPGDSGSFLAIDTNLQGLAAAAGAMSLRRRARTWRLPLTEQFDRAVAVLFAVTSRVSPLGARMIGDATYVRAMFGSAAMLAPIAAVVLGVLAVLDVNGLALAPSVALLGAIIFLGTLDAFAGFIAVIAFAIGIAISGGVTGVPSVRTLLGLAILGFGPALIAGASRPMRRPDHAYSAWERIGDFVVIPLVGAFAVQGTVNALPALSGYDMPIANQANLLALVALVGLVMRVCLEELAARAYPERITAVAPPDLPPHSTGRRLVIIAVRTFLFGFAAIAFIGNVWQLWVGLAVFAAAELCLLLAPRMPNSPTVYHFVPVGVPRFVLIVLVAIGLGTLATLVVGDGADLARYSFVLLLMPGLVLAALGMFGREPREGDVRWYLRPSLRNVYRVGGVLMVVAAVWLTQFSPIG